MKPFADMTLRGAAGLRMALLPFDNLTEDQGAAKTVENLVLVEFLKQSAASVVNPGEVNAVLLEQRLRVTTAIPSATVKVLGERLGVGYLMQGVVHEYQMQRGTTGQYPVVSVTLRLVDVSTGEIAWALSSSRRGNDRESLFGIGRVDSLEQLAQQMVEEMSDAFADSLKG